ncbi:hypothetical protein [Desulfosporosinus orientis]|nr:hypothetical protein [Desulfosporosinus orientis]
MDLWKALQSVDPEMRSAFIKETLKQALLGGDSQEPFNQLLISEDMTAMPQGEIYDSDDETQIDEITSSEADQAETYSLDDLFSQTSSLEPEENPDINMAAQEEVKPLPGFEYLMKHIIGMEDDEDILKILKGKT